MKKTRLFVVLMLILSIGTAAVFAANSGIFQAYKPLPQKGDIPFNAVYNWLDEHKGFASNGEIYVAVGYGGRADISKDLQNWTEVEKFTYEDLTYVAYTGEKFVAFNDRLDYAGSIPKDHKMNIYLSENGVDWSEQWVDIPQDVTNWHDYSFTEDEFVFIDTNNSNYYMTSDFKEWRKVPFCPEIDNIHSDLSIRKLNGQYILLDVVGGRPVNSRIFALSKDNEWVEKSSISGIMEHVSDLAYFNGSYYAFSYTNDTTPDFKSILKMSAYSSKDMSTWIKSNITTMYEESSEIISLHTYNANGKIHLIYSIEDHTADVYSDWTRTSEITSTDGISWEKYVKEVPIRNDDRDVSFSVLNGKLLLGLGSGNTIISKGDNVWTTLQLPDYGTGSKAVFVGNEFIVLQDSIPYETAPNTYATKTITTITKDGVNMDSVESVPRISHWTGREFIAGDKATTDFKTWKDLNIPEELSQFIDHTFYQWFDGLYLAQVYVSYSGDREKMLEDDELREKGYDRTVYIFDSNFSLVGKHMFDSEIQNIEFNNNIYFVTLKDDRVFRSIDAKDWVESSYTEMLGQPIRNGSSNYLRNNVTDNKISGVSISSDKQNWKSVVIDGEVLKNCSLLGDYYKAEGSESIYLSKDGVYWAKISVPYQHWNGYGTYSNSDYLLVNSFKWLFFYPMEAISAALDNPETLYKIQ